MSHSEDIGPLSLHQKQKGPKPKSHALLWIFLCLLMVIGTTLWFVRDMIFQDTTSKPTSSLPVEVMGSGTAVNGAVINDQTSTELAGQTQQDGQAEQATQSNQMGILDMLDGSKNAASAEQDALGSGLDNATGVMLDADGNPINAEVAFQEPLEDAVVRTAFVEDIAPWLVSLYYPKNTHPEARKSGIVLADISRINQRYGTTMTGLSWSGESLHQGRATVLEYVFVPTMIESIYALYADRFMENIAVAATARRTDGSVLTEAQVEEMYTLYAQHLRSYAAALDGIVRMTGLERSVEAWQLTTDKALEANADFTAKLFEYETARDAGKTAEAAEARKKMDAAGKAYQQAIIMRERARESLAESLRSSVNARRLDESSLLYLATWVKRRLDVSPSNKESLQSISLALKDLATRFDAAKSAD